MKGEQMSLINCQCEEWCSDRFLYSSILTGLWKLFTAWGTDH